MCLVQPSQIILSPHCAVSRLGIGCKTSLRAQVSELRPASAGGAQPALGVLSFPKRRVIDNPPVPPGVFVSLSPPAHSRHRCGFDAYRDTVRHGTPDDLAALTGLLARFRAIEGLVERRLGVFTGGPGPSCTSTTTRRACLRTSASATTSCVCRSTHWPSRRISWRGCARRRGSRARAECDELRLIAKPCDGPWGAGYEHRTPWGMTNSLDFDFGGTSVRATGGDER